MTKKQFKENIRTIKMCIKSFDPYGYANDFSEGKGTESVI